MLDQPVHEAKIKKSPTEEKMQGEQLKTFCQPSQPTWQRLPCISNATSDNVNVQANLMQQWRLLLQASGLIQPAVHNQQDQGGAAADWPYLGYVATLR